MSVVSIPGLHTPLASCAVFHQTGAPLVVPGDTPSTRFGTLLLDYMGATKLVDRAGAQWQLLPSARPAINATLLDALQSAGWSHGLVVTGTFSKAGNLTGFRPLFHLPYATMLSPFKGTKFVGTITALGPPAGVNATAWVRWNFAAAVNSTGAAKSQTRLPGVIVNLDRGVKEGGRCQRALCATKAQCDFYTRTFGTSASMTLMWDPAMHNQQDSELVGRPGAGGGGGGGLARGVYAPAAAAAAACRCRCMGSGQGGQGGGGAAQGGQQTRCTPWPAATAPSASSPP
jgi:hypothetical protein